MLLVTIKQSVQVMSAKRARTGDAITRTVSYAPAKASRAREFYKPKMMRGSSSLRKYVKQAIAYMAEKKVVINHGENVAISVAVGATTPVALSLAPSIAQGTSQNQRIGNQVKVTKASIRGHIGLLPYNALLNPQPAPVHVKMWLCRYKKLNTDTIGSTDIMSAFFDTGAGVAGFQGNIFDIEAFPNNDSWEVVTTKTVKIGASAGTNTIPSTNAQYFDNSPSVTPFEFEFGSKLGVCLFNDATLIPTNKNLFLVFQPVLSTGVASANLVPAELHYALKVEYIDL